jgi:hypothetical protein
MDTRAGCRFPSNGIRLVEIRIAGTRRGPPIAIYILRKRYKINTTSNIVPRIPPPIYMMFPFRW